MEPDQPLTRPEAQALLAYAESTYQSVTASQRRIAAASLAAAIIFGLLCAGSGAQWLSARSRVEQVRDVPLVEAVGVRIPDPRPALERAQLRLQSLVWGLVSTTAAIVALLFLGLYALARPPRVTLPPGATGTGAPAVEDPTMSLPPPKSAP